MKHHYAILLMGLLSLLSFHLKAQVGADCATPFVISTLPFNELNLSNCGMGNDYGTGGCGGSYMGGEDMVFQFTPTQSACYNMQLYAISGNADANILVFDGCPTGNNCIDSGDAQGSDAFLQIPLNAGTTYYVVVGSENTLGPNDCSTFNIYISDPDSAPVNDFCQNASLLNGLGSNYNATACDEPDAWTPDELFPGGGGWNGTICDGDGGWTANHNGVWYTFNNPIAQDVTIDVFNIVCDGTVGESLLQLGVWSNTGTCNLAQEDFYNCLVTVGDAELLLDNLPAGDYYLFCDGSAASLCTWGFASEQVINCQTPQIMAITSTLTQICNGGGTPVTFIIDTIGTQPMLVVWSLNGAAIDSNTLSLTVSPVADATYTVVATNGCGADTEIFEVVAAIPPTLTAAVPTDYTLCSNTPTPLMLTVNVSGTAPIAIAWTQNGIPIADIDNSISVTPTANAIYIATATNDCGTDSQIFSITINDPPTITATAPTQQSICTNAVTPINLSVSTSGTPPIGITWTQNGLPLPTTNPLLTLAPPFADVTYIATATNDCGSDTVSFTINALAIPTATLSGGGAICDNSGDALPISIALSGTPPYTFIYSIDGTVQDAISNITDDTYLFNAFEVGNYALVSVADAVCSGTVAGTATLSEIPLPAAPILPDTLYYCEGDTLGIISISPPGSVNWYITNPTIDPNAITSSENPLNLNQYISTTSSGTTTLWATLSVNGCAGAASPLTILVHPIPPLPAATPIAICQGEILPDLTAVGDNIVWYDAKPGTAGSQTIGTDNPLPLATWVNNQQVGTTVFWFDQTVNTCTSLPQSVEVSIENTPDMPITTSVSVCVGDSITPLVALSDAPIAWYSTPTATTPFAIGDTIWLATADTVWAMATDTDSGCSSAIAPAILTINTQDIPDFELDKYIYCAYDNNPVPYIIGTNNGIFSANNGLSINPQTGEIDLSQASLGLTYTITYTTQGICPADTQVQIIVHDISVLTSPDTVITEGETLALWADAVSSTTNDISYTWSSIGSLSCANCPEPFASPLATTTYNVIVTDIYACTDAESVTITVLPIPTKALIPSAFSPNSDGVNDVFGVIAFKATAISLQVYNRWGEQVFDTTEGMAWNGEHRGIAAEIGVYAYFANVTFADGTTQTYKGNVTLIR